MIEIPNTLVVGGKDPGEALLGLCNTGTVADLSYFNFRVQGSPADQAAVSACGDATSVRG